MNPFLHRPLFYFETPGEGSASPVSGTETEVPGETEPVTPAGESNTDPGNERQPVPYSRFQEVNEARKAAIERYAPIAELEQLGYTADDFQRLAAWETEYNSDPVGWALRNALETATDDGVKAQIEAAIRAKDGVTSAETPPAPASAPETEGEDEVPTWAKPIVDAHLRGEREAEERARAEVYDSILEGWKAIDADQKVPSPSEAAMASFIFAASSQADQPVDILRIAREGYLAMRDQILTESVTPTRNGDTPPRAVPASGDGAALSTTPERPRTLDQARRLAMEADARGTLVLEPE